MMSFFGVVKNLVSLDCHFENVCSMSMLGGCHFALEFNSY
jgi:hypothetical protein